MKGSQKKENLKGKLIRKAKKKGKLKSKKKNRKKKNHYCPVKILDLEINRVDHHPLGR